MHISIITSMARGNSKPHPQHGFDITTLYLKITFIEADEKVKIMNNAI